MHHPLGVFALLVGISAAVPPLIRRLGLPDLVGLLLAGILVGPHALNWVDASSEVVRLLSDLGAVYLLFTMGLEIDLDEFNRVKSRSLFFWFSDSSDWRSYRCIYRHPLLFFICLLSSAGGIDGYSHTIGLSDSA